MLARILTIAVAATLAFAVVPASADIPPPDRRHDVPELPPRPTPAPKPNTGPPPLPPPPTPQKDTAAPFVAVGFFALFALLGLWLWRQPRERSL